MSKQPSFFDMIFNRYELHLTSALAKISDKRYTDAIEDLNIARKCFQSNGFVVFVRGLCNIRLANYGEALDEVQYGWTTAPPSYFHIVGSALAASAYCCAMANRPNESRAFSNAFHAYIKFFDATVRLIPEIEAHRPVLQYDTQVVLAILHDSIRQTEMALEFPSNLFAMCNFMPHLLRPSQPSNPASASMKHFHRGAELASMKQHQQAVDEYTLALEADPTFGRTYLLRADSRSALHDFSGVLQDGLSVISNTPSTCPRDIMTGLACASLGYKEAGRKDLAISAVDAALIYLEFARSLAPFSPEIWQRSELSDAVASQQYLAEIRGFLVSDPKRSKF